MDTFTTLVAVTTFFFIYLGERFEKGAYLWLGALTAILLALRMGELIYYMITAGLIAVLVYRTFDTSTDVRIDADEDLEDE